jgi:hypothetical protein
MAAEIRPGLGSPPRYLLSEELLGLGRHELSLVRLRAECARGRGHRSGRGSCNQRVSDKQV